jgi:cellulose synthase/poly-beta-1,6-N-acetylglucosamine synthase-like glycosyltransferase
LTVSLHDALALSSPRYLPRSTPAASLIVHGAVGIVWLLLFASTFSLGGIYAWSTGVAYILYDTVLLAFVGYQTLALLRPRVPASASHAVPERQRIAVVVAAHNEAAVLYETITSMFSQADPPDAIIIADDGSTDGTSRLLVERFGLDEPVVGEWATSRAFPSLHWLRLAHGGKARALNVALQSPIDACRTPIVMTVDADTHLSPDAVAAMRTAFSDEPALVAATGVLEPVCGPTIVGRLFEWFQTYEYIRNFLSRYAWMRVDSLLLISGAFAGFRREAVVAVGGFDPHCLVEDYELIHRLARHSALHGLGWRSRVIGQAQARTEAPSAIAPFLRQRRRWFGGFLQTQYWYRAMVGDGRRYGNVGRWMLPVKAIDTMQPIFGLTALGILIVAIVHGRIAVIVPVSAWIIAKVAIDLGFHLWSVHLYRRWVGATTNSSFGLALLAALAEPFSFQILRHLGALLGWVTFLTRQRDWGKQERTAAIAGGAPGAEPGPRH